MEVIPGNAKEIKRIALFASAGEGRLERVQPLLQADADPNPVSTYPYREHEVVWIASTHRLRPR